MSSKRELRSAGSTTAQTLDSTKLYKLNSSGSIVEATTVGATDIVFSGSKSSLRRLADLERNVSILAAKALTDDGEGVGTVGVIDYAKTAGKWFTARTLSLTGDVTGSASIDGSGNVSLTTTIGANTVILGTDTTGNYVASLVAGTGITLTNNTGEGATPTVAVDTSTIATKSYVDSAVAGKDNTDEITEGATNLYFTNARARSALSASTGISYNSTTGAISCTITQYADSNARAAVSASGSLSYNSSTGVFSYTTPSTSGISEGSNLYYTDARARAAISGTAPVSYNSSTGAISMAAATSTTNGYMTSTYAAKLDGIASGATANTGTVTSVAAGSYLTGGTITTTGTLAVDATSANTASKVVARDASGNFSAGTITAALSGNATTATTATNVSGGSVSATTGSFSSTVSTGALTVSGAITATGEITAYYSDKNLKKDIVEITDPIAKVMSLRGVTFRPNETALALGITDKEEVGVIAQEVEAVLPQLVTPSAFAGYKTVKYDKLTALLLEAVKAQQLQIDALRAEIAKLGGSAKTEL
jgi:hypothetical protein